MKFSRIKLLNIINSQQPTEEELNNNPMKALSNNIFTNSNIDFLICFILSILILLTHLNRDNLFIYQNPINYYLILKITVNLIIYYFIVLIIKYVVPKSKSIQNYNIQSNRNSINSNEGDNRNQNNYLVYLIPHENQNIFNKTLNTIIFNNWFLINSIIVCIQNFLFIYSFGLNILFYFTYIYQKDKIDKKSYLFIHKLLLEIYEFYSIFRICFFLIKIIVQFNCIPIYISSIFLGYVEDKFNIQLNKLINTTVYTGRNSLSLLDQNRISNNQIEECSICLNNFQIGEIVSTLPCSKRHTFHTCCLEQWFNNNASCPLCRTNFNQEFRMLLPLINQEHQEQIINNDNDLNNNLNNDLNNNLNNDLNNNLNNDLNNNLNNDLVIDNLNRLSNHDELLFRGTFENNNDYDNRNNNENPLLNHRNSENIFHNQSINNNENPFLNNNRHMANSMIELYEMRSFSLDDDNRNRNIQSMNSNSSDNDRRSENSNERVSFGPRDSIEYLNFRRN